VSLEFFLRLVGMVAGGYLGWTVSDTLSGSSEVPRYLLPWLVSLMLAGAALGLLITPYLVLPPFRWVRSQISQLPANHLLAGITGMVLGLIVAALLAFPLSTLPGPFGLYGPFLAAIVMAYLGIALMVLREQDIRLVLTSYFRGNPGLPPGRSGAFSDKMLVDTSAIIDGRIADISQTGFLRGILVVPQFVLDEMRHIADDGDALKRGRGRRGLELLGRMQQDGIVPIEITDADFSDLREVDAKLVRLARNLRAPVLTNDYNLSRVAQLQGVQVLNINELANAVKPVYQQGEELTVRIVQEGQGPEQGIGFLEDGTMVVVESGRKYVGSLMTVLVSRVIQTNRGRMVFAAPRPD
jgi:uncharacterized protein YacL